MENFPNLEKDIPIQMQEDSRTPNRPDKNRTTPNISSLKQQDQKLRKKQVTYKGKPIKITADFST
jgi:hypothetical protein